MDGLCKIHPWWGCQRICQVQLQVCLQKAFKIPIKFFLVPQLSVLSRLAKAPCSQVYYRWDECDCGWVSSFYVDEQCMHPWWCKNVSGKSAFMLMSNVCTDDDTIHFSGIACHLSFSRNEWRMQQQLWWQLSLCYCMLRANMLLEPITLQGLCNDSAEQRTAIGPHWKGFISLSSSQISIIPTQIFFSYHKWP